MSQHGFESFAASARSGGDLSSILEALQSGHIGTARPSYVEDGMVWHKHRPAEGVGGTIEKYFTFGGVDILEGAFDLSTGNFSGAVAFATQAEAEAGTDNAKLMSPLRVKQAIDTLDVAATIASFSAGEIGTTAFLSDNTARVRTYTAGQNYAGSQLAYSGFYSGAGLGNGVQYAGSSGAGVSGTWQALGSATHPSASLLHHTQFLRIA
jgi:hypothetical protein